MKKFQTLIGSHIHEIEICESSSKTLHEWLQNQVITEGTVLITHEQSSGRGQGINQWSSEPGKNLTFSFVLYPENLTLSQSFILNMAITLGVYDYLTQYFHDSVKIKWPNDLLVYQKKIAGILIENTIREHKVSQSVIGIGININQEKFQGLPEAVSMAVLLKRNSVLMDELNMVLNCLDEKYAHFRLGNHEKIREEYSRSLSGYQECSKFIKEGKEFTGIIVGIGSDGKLALQQGGKLSYYSHHELRQCY